MGLLRVNMYKVFATVPGTQEVLKNGLLFKPKPKLSFQNYSYYHGWPYGIPYLKGTWT
jgi:hypothetical protein